MGVKKLRLVEDGKSCCKCWGALSVGDTVHTLYGNVSGVMPENGEAFGVPVKCEKCFTKSYKEKRTKKEKLHNYPV